MRWLALFLLLAACGRPLTPNETAFSTLLFADTLDTRRVSIGDGLAAGAFTYTRKVRPRLTCTERLYPPITEARTVTVAPGAMAVFHNTHFRSDLYRDDFLRGYPERIDLADAMLFAHEMVHVWQWQNRDRTGYHPLRAAGEHGRLDDPYLIDPNTRTRFLDHGFEQQGTIVEEYVCCRVLAPEAARTRRLHAMISEVFPVADLDRRITERVLLPWAGVELRGICD